MERIEVSAFLIKAYLDGTLEGINEDFYYNLEKIRTPVESVNVSIGNRLLEKKLPLIFPRNTPFCKSTIHRYETKTSFIQLFDLFNGCNFEGYLYPGGESSTQERVIELSEEVGKILNPFADLKIVNVEKVIKYGKLPYVAHVFDNGKHISSRIKLDWYRANNLRESDFIVNLNIFYEFFKDLR